MPEFVRGVDRPNISLLRWKVLPNERLETTARLCRIPIPAGGKVMIFVPTQKIAEELQDYLRDQGLETPFYHAKLESAWEREQAAKKVCGREPPTSESDHLYERFWYGTRRSERTISH